MTCFKKGSDLLFSLFFLVFFNSSAASHAPSPQKRTLQKLQALHAKGEPITVLTAHDYPSGFNIEQAGNIDVCLVGDSLAMVACGYESTNQLSLDEMLYHCRSVARGCKSPLLVADMPFGTYQLDVHDAVSNALKLIQQGHMEAVKLEGGAEIAPLVKRLVDVGIPVMGHVGLKPQHAVASSGFKVQGKTASKALQVYQDALAIQEAGAFSMVIEAVPSKLGAFISSKLKVPTISIGAGPECSGQVLVQLDMLGGFDRFMPRFCKPYANLSAVSIQAIRQYGDEVKLQSFPEEGTHTYPIKEDEWARFQQLASDLEQGTQQ